jgi:hypothetical protein
MAPVSRVAEPRDQHGSARAVVAGSALSPRSFRPSVGLTREPPQSFPPSRCRKPRPSCSDSVVVLVEDAAESIASPDGEVVQLI